MNLLKEENNQSENEEDVSEDESRLALAYDPSQLSGSDGPPQNGHDYLRMVQMQRSQIPTISYSNPPDTVVDEINPMDVASSEKQNDCHEDLNYREDVLKNFQELKANIDSIREKVPPRLPIDEQQLSEKQIKDYMDRSERRAISLIKQMNSGYPPQVSALVKKNQYEIHKTLELLADQCEDNPNYSTLHTDWIYSLMATLQEPIESDIYSTLRRLARLCLIRKKMYEKRKASSLGGGELSEMDNAQSYSRSSEVERVGGEEEVGRDKNGKRRENNEELVKAVEEEEYTSSLLIICIVRHHFGQVDLK